MKRHHGAAAVRGACRVIGMKAGNCGRMGSSDRRLARMHDKEPWETGQAGIASG